MELRFSPLFSGSSGNATYVGCDDTHLLVDAGVSGSRITQEQENMICRYSPRKAPGGR